MCVCVNVERFAFLLIWQEKDKERQTMHCFSWYARASPLTKDAITRPLAVPNPCPVRATASPRSQACSMLQAARLSVTVTRCPGIMQNKGNLLEAQLHSATDRQRGWAVGVQWDRQLHWRIKTAHALADARAQWNQSAGEMLEILYTNKCVTCLRKIGRQLFINTWGQEINKTDSSIYS